MKWIFSLLLVLTLSLFLVSCTKKTETTTIGVKEDIVTVEDSLGRSVTIDRNKVNKVVCVGAGALRLYSYIGDMAKIVGAEDIDRAQDGADLSLFGAKGFRGISRPYYDFNKDYLKTVVTVGLGGPRNQNAETEKILAVNPDLIISQYLDIEKANKLSTDTDTPVILVKYGNNHNVFDETLYNSFTILGKVLNKEARAKEIVDYIKAQKELLETYKTNATEAEKNTTYYIGCLGNWGTQDILSTSLKYPAFDAVGVKYTLDSSATITDGKITLEKLVEVDPDVIILDAAGISTFLSTTYAEHKDVIDNLKAVKNGKVYVQMPFNAYYTNIEISIMNAFFIASIAYSSSNINVEAKSTEILAKFLGTGADYNLVKNMQYSYGGYGVYTIGN